MITKFIVYNKLLRKYLATFNSNQKAYYFVSFSTNATKFDTKEQAIKFANSVSLPKDHLVVDEIDCSDIGEPVMD